MMNLSLTDAAKSTIRHVLSIFILLVCFASFAKAQEPSPLFACETNRSGKYLSIYGIEQEPDKPWTDVQYRFGSEGKPPEMVYPEDASRGAKLIFFSHEYRKNRVYHVSIRFVHGGYTYRIFSDSTPPRGDGSAGVIVTDAKGRVRTRIFCIERPYMFAGYLQRTLACDLKNPHGKAACQDKPYHPRR